MASAPQRYISNELVHFVGRGQERGAQFALLLKILKEGWLLHPPFNPNISGNLTVTTDAPISNNAMYAPEIVCLADIPLDDLRIHAAKYSPIGLTFSKDFIAKAGGCPVHYIPQHTQVRRMKSLSPGRIGQIVAEYGSEHLDEHLMETISKSSYFDEMLQEFHRLFSEFRTIAMQSRETPSVPPLFRKITDLERFFNFHIFSYVKFFDHVLSDDHPDNFYFEREWRIVGNVPFSLDDVKTVIFPSEYAKDFRAEMPAYAGAVRFMD